MRYDHNVNVDFGGLVAFHAESAEPDDSDLEIGTGEMLLWSNDTQTLAFFAMAKAGAIRLIVEQFPDKPELLADPYWGLLGERNAEFVATTFVIADWEAVDPDVPPIRFSKPGPHMLRLYGHGRNSPVELQEVTDTDINEQYMLHIWSTQP